MVCPDFSIMEETFIDGTLTFQRDTHFSFFAGRYITVTNYIAAPTGSRVYDTFDSIIMYCPHGSAFIAYFTSIA